MHVSNKKTIFVNRIPNKETPQKQLTQRFTQHWHCNAFSITGKPHISNFIHKTSWH